MTDRSWQLQSWARLLAALNPRPIDVEAMPETFGEPPALPDERRLTWAAPTLPPLEPAQPLATVRAAILDRILAYLRADPAPDHALLIAVPPGVGKSFLTTQAAQVMTDEGKRGLFCASRHDHLATLEHYPHFDRPSWYHWLPIHKAASETDPIGTTCRYADDQRSWTAKGLPSQALCRAACDLDGWQFQHCGYRRQRYRVEPIVYAMHEHLTNGLFIETAFDYCVIDELPLKAFIEDRFIPKSGIRLGWSDPLRTLLDVLYELATTTRRVLAGYDLMKQIAPFLGRCYEQIDAGNESVCPPEPALAELHGATTAPYYYAHRLLAILRPEYDAYLERRRDWVARVRVTPEGLRLLSRREPWVGLPKRLVILDATGKPAIYETLLRRPVVTYAPTVERTGRIYQVVGRLNGISTVVTETGALTKQGEELLGLTKAIARNYPGQRVGVVTFKDAVSRFAAEFGERNVLHFGALRGSNDLEGCAAVIVAGGYAPPPGEVMRVAAALHPERIEPFASDETGSGYAPALREYRLRPGVARPSGVNPTDVPSYPVRGFWTDRALATIHEQYREAEMRQAAHRARPNNADADTWILSNLVTDELLDGVFVTPPTAATGAPEGIGWRNWQILEPLLAEWQADGTEVTIELLADATGASITYVRSQRWLQRILEADPDGWAIGSLVSTTAARTRGRPRLALRGRADDPTDFDIDPQGVAS